MFCFQNNPAYLSTAVSYGRKLFVSLLPGLLVLLLVLCAGVVGVRLQPPPVAVGQHLAQVEQVARLPVTKLRLSVLEIYDSDMSFHIMNSSNAWSSNCDMMSCSVM